MNIVYSTPSCGICRVLKKKMELKHIPFEVVEDVARMRAAGVVSVPVLELEDGTRLVQIEAIRWVDQQEG